jgi:thiamine kinase-like enzyme
VVEEILGKFGIEREGPAVPIGNGHINKTYKVGSSYILQEINTNVFDIAAIANNLENAKQHLSKNHPDYLFIAPLKNIDAWRIYPYIENTYTIENAGNVDQAYKASKAFGRFGKAMQGADLSKYRPTIKRFHDLQLRYEQLLSALNSADQKTIDSCSSTIQSAIKNKTLVDHYNSIIKSNTLKPGIFHNDTKINNILFDKAGNAIAVIDLDTVMEGYFIYDLGDLVRTVVSPVSEEEKDLDKIVVRKEFYDAVIEGYLAEMDVDKSLASFAGQMMTYIMAIRFLADYLRGNTYYHVTYADQNLVRAKNQLRLLELLQSGI